MFPQNGEIARFTLNFLKCNDNKTIFGYIRKDLPELAAAHILVYAYITSKLDDNKLLLQPIHWIPQTTS